MEIESLNASLSENILANKIRSDEKFVDDKNSFSRLKYEKFLLENNLTAPIYEDSYTSSNIPEDFKWYNSKDLNYQKVKAGYKKYLSKISDDVLDLSKFKITEPMYIDGIHYYPQFNFKIAEKISKIILE